ncbi:MAG TPA: SDR family NAD(P)-dependent oxidoreductase [Ktedonobacteraceae bacterium]|nr:SDR family NAD(P)-dependent oxidoreductase [Ktedonobacteraceae bacterium]
MESSTALDTDDTAIALVGMAGRFPGASDIEAFWENIAGGVKSLRLFSEQELLAAGVSPTTLAQPNYVRVGTLIEGLDLFDAAFFGYTRREAEIMDPQHRLFLECAWQALEDAACVPETYPGLIGVFAGSGFSTYAARNLYTHPDLVESLGELTVNLGNELDSLTSTVSYKLNLKGPSMAVQTFCSTSLVAVHLACRSLVTYECDAALAGGVAITVPQQRGYLYEEGGILSPDGECRTFDARARGSVMGSGVGVVVLKRLQDALKDGDHIYALIRGSAVNNDGSVRVSYTAPGLGGQTEVIAEALGNADVAPETIGYVEAHGTATMLGDAVELAAMLKVFSRTAQKRFCALGSVKPNVGHLDRASGVTGLIKTALALHHKQLPPSLNFEQTNRDIDLENSPFYVNTVLRPWLSPGMPRRAGVSSFGLGGTNAHVVLEEAPMLESINSLSSSSFLLVLSARTKVSLCAIATNLARYLRAHPQANLADLAYTLQLGRTTFNYRRTLLCHNQSEALTLLEQGASEPELFTYQAARARPLTFLFADKADLCGDLALALYQNALAFRRQVDDCCRLLRAYGDLDCQALFTRPEYTHWASFIGTYALARMYEAWGVRPRAVLGRGAGMYAAACFSGMLALEDALLFLAKHRSPQLVVTAPVQLSCQEPAVPCLSYETGEALALEQANDVSYWLSLLTHDPASSCDSSGQVLQMEEQVLFSIGTKRCFQSVLAQHDARAQQQVAALSLETGAEPVWDAVLTTLGLLWQAGVTIDWAAFYSGQRCQRLSLPTYPFERQRYWIDPPLPQALPTAQSQARAEKVTDIAAWGYQATWQHSALPLAGLRRKATWLIFVDQPSLGELLAQQLLASGERVIKVYPRASFAAHADGSYAIRPGEPGDYLALCKALFADGTGVGHILHCWGVSHRVELAGAQAFQTQQETGFYSLFYLAQALARHALKFPIDISVVANGLYALRPGEQVVPEKQPLLGACKVIAQENTSLLCRVIDVELSGEESRARLVDCLLAELQGTVSDPMVSYREDQRRVQVFQPAPLKSRVNSQETRFRQRGVYVLTGGFGRVSRVLAEYLARTFQARLVLLGRSPFPEREQWSHWLRVHETENQISQRIRHVRYLETLGAEVLPLQVDVADSAQLGKAISLATNHFGVLHGVIHAATASGDELFRLVQDTNRAACEEHFRAKVYGLYALEQALRGHQLDFCVLFSSISSILGGLGFIGYTAANLFMDSFAYQRNQEQRAIPWISVNWDTWQFPGQDHGVLGGSIATYTLTPEEGCEALERMLVSGNQHIILSTGDLAARVRQWLLLEGIRDQEQVDNESHEQSAAPGPLVVGDDGYERILTTIWQDALGLEQVGLYENFFDLGGNSLTGLQVIARLRKALHMPIPVVALFEAPTISMMIDYLRAATATSRIAEEQPYRQQLVQRRDQARKALAEREIAIVAMTGRFPGASSVEQFWQNLRSGMESIAHFTDEELLASGLDPELFQNPNYVKARPILDHVEQFDASFFGYSPREAELLDPQHRLFLECCWEALERAAYDPQRYEGLIGVFGGANISTYLHSLLKSPEVVEELKNVVNGYQISVSADKDSLTTAVSYKLNLRGPSLAVQTFCSTSLVAVHLACQSLRQGECDLALAGGVSVHVPVREGHLYEEGGQESPDGHCRTFDARAAGSMFGDGVGVVVLKRLSEAVEDGDQILAVVRGSAINNDGATKVSYAAPSVVGQAEVVLAALADAGVEAESISYVEAHGTATKLGDPIEVASLTRAYRSQTEAVGYCAIGSVKTNVGHLDRAAGVSGLVKTVLALQHEELPASLHYERPNPEIDFASSPFVVNAALRAWSRQQGRPRRAGINSLGMGGTNVHVIVEEAPERGASGPSRPWQMLVLSAKTASALEHMTEQLGAYLRQHEELSLADVACTLQQGRQRFEYRRMLVCQDQREAVQLLERGSAGQVWSHREQRIDRPVAFLFPGLGELYTGIAHNLYAQEKTFRTCVDRCCAVLESYLDVDLRELLCKTERLSYAQNGHGQHSLHRLLSPDHSDPSTNADIAENELVLRQTRLAQPATFVLEYALARLLMQWGLQPQAMLGYSLGEYVAACLAGVLSLEDALMIVARRAQMIQELPNGTMIAATISEDLASSYLSAEISLAAVNAPGVCVLAGAEQALACVTQDLEKRGLAWRRVETTHAFHSRQMLPLRAALVALLETVTLNPPRVPYISDVTGTWVTAEQATSPEYWAEHMCQPVRFSAGVTHLLQEGEYALLEIGAGHVLSSFIKQHPACDTARAGLIFPTLPAVYEPQSETMFLLTTLGKLWLAGVTLDWQNYTADEQRQRVLLPTYPFERQRYWIEARPGKQNRPSQVQASRAADPIVALVESDGDKRVDLADWFYLPSWKRSVGWPGQCGESPAQLQSQCWLFFVDRSGLADQLAARLRCPEHEVVTVVAGTLFAKAGACYTVRPDVTDDYEMMLKDLREQGRAPQHIVHCWAVGSGTGAAEEDLDAEMTHGFYSLLSLTQALGNLGLDRCRLTVVSSDMHDVTGTEALSLAKATLLGPCKVIPQEYPDIACRSIDVSGITEPGQCTRLLQQLLSELTGGASEPVVALRGPHRWVQTFEQVRLPEQPAATAQGVFRQRGIYLITGGLGGIGLAMADYLARTVQARLVLLGRKTLPPRDSWPTLLAADADESTIARQVRSILRLEEQGAQVLLVQADVCDEAQMRQALRNTLEKFGELHGVLHVAGVPASGLMQLKAREMAESVLGPKVRGTQVLGRVLRDLPLDFLALFSSVTSTTGGGPGQVDYCAANAFLDAYAHKHASDYGRTVALDWSEWQWNAWEDGLNGYPQEAQQYFRQRRQRFGISFEEGAEALVRVLNSPVSHVVVASEDFQRMLEGSQDYSIATILQALNAFREEHAATSYARPVLGTEYVPPESELEREIAATWSELLGIGQIGLLDNFFELGGHSLMGTQLIARLRRAFGVDIRLITLFEAPTIAELAVAVELLLIAEIEQSSEGEMVCIQETNF